MALERCKENGTGSAGTNHSSRWAPGHTIKDAARKHRRAADKAAIGYELIDWTGDNDNGLTWESEVAA